MIVSWRRRSTYSTVVYLRTRCHRFNRLERLQRVVVPLSGSSVIRLSSIHSQSPSVEIDRFQANYRHQGLLIQQPLRQALLHTKKRFVTTNMSGQEAAVTPLNTLVDGHVEERTDPTKKGNEVRPNDVARSAAKEEEKEEDEQTKPKRTENEEEAPSATFKNGCKRGPNEGGQKGKRKKTNQNKVVASQVVWAGRSSKEVHVGSYADPEQRALFNVTLPDKPDPAPTTITSKKKVAVLLGYLGTAYGGFQINKGVRTLQAELELALLKAGLLSGDNFGSPSKYRWSTSGRTDKGVHAAAQTVSFKMELSHLHLQNMQLPLEQLNAVLPSDIRVLSVVRTTRNFCAKTQRDRVRYQYMIPSFVFSDQLPQILNSVVDYPANGQPIHAPVSPAERKQIQAALSDYRATRLQLDTLQRALQLYVGTHSFHNFTRRCSASEARSKRYIIEFSVQAPVLVDGVEWIPTTVTGQSFLLNQIRKMACLAMDVTRGVTGIETVVKALDNDKGNGEIVRIALAPAEGLYLDMSFYHSYNIHISKNSNSTEAPPLDWSEPGTSAHSRWLDFRDNVIMKHVVAEEAAQGNFIQHLYMQEHCFDFKSFYQNDDDDNDDEENEESANTNPDD